MSAKLIVRNAYAAILSAIPLSWLNSVRVGYQFAPPRSVKRKVAEIALRFLRYRRLDSSVSTFSPPGRPDIHFVNVESVIARRVFWLGQSGYEGDESRFWEYFCSRAEAIVEIGANIGMYTVLGAKAAGQTPYAAVEPHPLTLEALRRNVALNNLGNVRVVAAAVVGTKQFESMTLLVPETDPDTTPAGAYLSSGGEGKSELAQSPRYPVDLVEAREIIDGADLIKLDVEGYEHEILFSLGAYVKDRCPTIFIEVRDETPRLRGLLQDWINSLGYRCYVPSRKGLIEIPGADLLEVSLSKTYGARDIILSVESPPEISSTVLSHEPPLRLAVRRGLWLADKVTVGYGGTHASDGFLCRRQPQISPVSEGGSPRNADASSSARGYTSRPRTWKHSGGYWATRISRR